MLRRHPGEITAQESFFHFFETFEVGSAKLRVDYLFDWNGKPLVSWSSDSVLAPIFEEGSQFPIDRLHLKPDWIINGRLVAFAYQAGIAIISSLGADSLVSAAQEHAVFPLEFDQARLSVPREIFPYKEYGHRVRPFDSRIAVADTAWSLSWQTENPADRTILWRLSFAGSKLSIGAYQIPSQFDLMDSRRIKPWKLPSSLGDPNGENRAWRTNGLELIGGYNNLLILVARFYNREVDLLTRAVLLGVDEEKYEFLGAIHEDVRYFGSSAFGRNLWFLVNDTNDPFTVRATNLETGHSSEFQVRVPLDLPPTR